MKRMTCLCANSGPKLLFSCILIGIFLLVSAQFSLGYEKEIDRLSISMAEKISAAGKKTIAVVDFTDLQGNVTELGRFLAEEFSAALVNAGKGFVVVDRIHLQSILKEHKLSASGIIDPTTARQLGKIAGVDAIITGTITPFGEKVRLSAKVLETDSAKVICASRGNIPKTDAIEELLGRGIEGPSGGTPSRAAQLTKPRGKPKPTIQKVEAHNFTFDLLKCKLSGESMTCEVLVTNGEKDREFKLNANTLGSPSRCFDNSGNAYIADKAQVGSSQGGYASTMLVSGVPTKASVSFKNISAQDRMLSLLELACKADEEFKVQFRNVPLE